MTAPRRKPAGARHLSAAGLRLIATFEGFRAEPYPDSGGKATIGYGHLIQPADRFRPPISEAEALGVLRRDVASAEAAVRDAVHVPVTQREFDAMASLAFNIGGGAFARSTLVRLLNRGDRAGAAAEFSRYIRAGGKVVAGLVRRRQVERNVFSR